MSSLHNVVMDHEKSGARRFDSVLGFQKMPDGFALMLDADGMYYYWINANDEESCIHWNKWSVYKMAKKFSEGVN